MSQVGLDSIGYALKRLQTELRATMDAELRAHDLSVPQYACLRLLSRQPGLTNAQLARGAFVSRQAMHQLLAGLRAAALVIGDGQGRHEHFTITPAGAQRLAGAIAAVMAVQERMLSPLDDAQRARFYTDLTACAEALRTHQHSSPAAEPAPATIPS